MISMERSSLVNFTAKCTAADTEQQTQTAIHRKAPSLSLCDGGGGGDGGGEDPAASSDINTHKHI